MDKNKKDQIKINDLLFFDNLALVYLVQETPLTLLAKAIMVIDTKIANSIFTILTEKQKEILSVATLFEKKPSDLEKEQIIKSLILIAQNLYEKGLIYKKGLYFYGKQKQ